MSSVSVLGSGAWGTTMAQVLVDAGNSVMLWGRNSEVVSEINSAHTNSKFLPGITLPSSLSATTSIEEALRQPDYVVMAIPSQSLRENLENWQGFFPSDKPVISTLKGIELGTHLRMTEVIEKVLAIDPHNLGLITGPNLASELILRQPAGAVGASTNPELATAISEIFKTKYFRVYTSPDLIGCELAGAFKNVIALAVGMCVGMGLGENTRAMLITRGLNEVTKLGVALGAQPLTFAGLAGMGDLVATCSSSLSRNRQFGEVLGQSESYEKARAAVTKTVEGVSSAAAVVELAHLVGVEIPIIEAVADVVSNTLTPQESVQRLMALNTGAEIDH
jgi:glycerol-3-phosphate dehydrogenase (NAD(P)+)